MNTRFTMIRLALLVVFCAALRVAGGADAPPAEPAPPAKVVSDASVLAAEPEFSVAADGTATVRWKTVAPRPRGWICAGVFLPDQDLDIPRWQTTVPEKEKAENPATEHEAVFPVTDLASLAAAATGKPNGAARLAVRIAVAGSGEEPALLDRTYGVRWSNGTYQRAAAVVEGPAVCLPEATSVTIAFRTDLATRAAVLVRSPHGERMVFESDREATQHEIRAAGLFADALYSYEVRITPADDPALTIASPSARFRTPPPREFKRPFTFALLSDARAGAGGGEHSIEGVDVRTLSDLLTIAYRSEAQLVVFAGDCASGYTTSETRFRQELRSWKRAARPVAAYLPLVVAAGNHEALIDAWSDGAMRDREDLPMERVFAEEFVHFPNGPEAAPGAPPYRELVYSFDFGNTHFACVLTSYWWTNRPGAGPGCRNGTVDDRQLAWLEKDLREARGRGVRHLFVAGHAPGFPCGGHADEAMYWNGTIAEVNAMRERFWKLLGDAGVVAYLCGDENNYSRVRVDAGLVPGMARPVWQIVSGGAGASYHVKDTKVPWSSAVAHFSCQRHVCLFEVAESRVDLRVVSETGGSIEQVPLVGE
jgi:3',5'-cyclic AMP phosphodiesterase CpdA